MTNLLGPITLAPLRLQPRGKRLGIVVEKVKLRIGGNLIGAMRLRRESTLFIIFAHLVSPTTQPITPLELP